MHTQKVDDFLRSDTVAVSSVHLSEDLLFVEVARLGESCPLVLKLNYGEGTSSWE
jgi:hypothetical protein